MPIRFQVDGDFYDHPKAIDASDAAVALWTRAGSYSTAKLLDGFVPEGMLARLSKSDTPFEAAQELVRCGLWKRVKSGFRFHQWEQRNLTRARVESDRDYDRAKKRRQRHGESSQAKGETVPSGHEGDSQRDTRGNPGGIPPLSVSVSVSESVSGSGRSANSGPAPPSAEPPARCPEHLDDNDPPPCGRCAEARRVHERWETTKATWDQHWDRNAPKCPKHRGQKLHNCRDCLSEAKGGIDA